MRRSWARHRAEMTAPGTPHEADLAAVVGEALLHVGTR